MLESQGLSILRRHHSSLSSSKWRHRRLGSDATMQGNGDKLPPHFSEHLWVKYKYFVSSQAILVGVKWVGIGQWECAREGGLFIGLHTDSQSPFLWVSRQELLTAALSRGREYHIRRRWRLQAKSSEEYHIHWNCFVYFIPLSPPKPYFCLTYQELGDFVFKHFRKILSKDFILFSYIPSNSYLKNKLIY
jgi:hypothetical protein